MRRTSSITDRTNVSGGVGQLVPPAAHKRAVTDLSSASYRTALSRSGLTPPPGNNTKSKNILAWAGRVKELIHTYDRGLGPDMGPLTRATGYSDLVAACGAEPGDRKSDGKTDPDSSVKPMSPRQPPTSPRAPTSPVVKHLVAERDDSRPVGQSRSRRSLPGTGQSPSRSEVRPSEVDMPRAGRRTSSTTSYTRAKKASVTRQRSGDKRASQTDVKPSHAHDASRRSSVQRLGAETVFDRLSRTPSSQDGSSRLSRREVASPDAKQPTSPGRSLRRTTSDNFSTQSTRAFAPPDAKQSTHVGRNVKQTEDADSENFSAQPSREINGGRASGGLVYEQNYSQSDEEERQPTVRHAETMTENDEYLQVGTEISANAATSLYQSARDQNYPENYTADVRALPRLRDERRANNIEVLSRRVRELQAARRRALNTDEATTRSSNPGEWPPADARRTYPYQNRGRRFDETWPGVSPVRRRRVSEMNERPTADRMDSQMSPRRGSRPRTASVGSTHLRTSPQQGKGRPPRTTHEVMTEPELPRQTSLSPSPRARPSAVQPHRLPASEFATSASVRNDDDTDGNDDDVSMMSGGAGRSLGRSTAVTNLSNQYLVPEPLDIPNCSSTRAAPRRSPSHPRHTRNAPQKPPTSHWSPTQLTPLKLWQIAHPWLLHMTVRLLQTAQDVLGLPSVVEARQQLRAGWFRVLDDWSLFIVVLFTGACVIIAIILS